ncbi:heme-dependent oxidative N-demethylase family protein [Acetobacter papayae]|uniref:heme-dependent oxidative N-demethylase family protein n=1 Tax=Acetobacter papayae TaxID=1076592 RepID=UPI0039EAB360
MTVQTSARESYRPPYQVTNSAETIMRFPFPFPEDIYMYSMNVEPHIRSGPVAAMRNTFDIDEHYVAECAEKARILQEDPKRCIVLPHMREAEWDFVELAMTTLSDQYPQHFSLRREGLDWHWVNRLLGYEQSFVFGDAVTLPLPPFEYMARQMQGDFTLHDQREDDLWMDGGMVTAQADWSLKFDLGMSFRQWHAPVPKAAEMGVFDRGLRFLLMLQHEKPVRRLNWTMTINPRLDTSPENFMVWGADRASVTPENVADKVHLRVELQTLYRLPRSNAILFSIRCYLMPVRDIMRVGKWRKRLHRVLRDLDPALSSYKGLDLYRQTVVDFLAQYDDGAPLSNGIQPDAEQPENVLAPAA